MRWLVITLALLLSACWEGRDLYVMADARPVFAPGTYRVTTADGESEVARVSTLAGGTTSIEVDGETTTWGLTPLDDEGKAYVHWMTDASAGQSKPNQTYYLVLRQSGENFSVYAPSCEGKEADVAKAAGAVIISGMIATCRFGDRGSLESAMRQVQPADKKRITTIVRIGDL